MFYGKKIKELATTIIVLEEHIRSIRYDLKQFKGSLVECETCGAVIKKENAVKGKPVMVEKKTLYTFPYLSGDPIVYEIRHPHYCKLDEEDANPAGEKSGS